ncbi:pectinesterase/pectinesterase inhibitor PPE8B-like [Trifolium pratense]|uniref:pectinesterase/pectinesterase inhibitor PPE8B-like n=1 Tax=Trifolium pratense TaxID=57577 RepID=UPI001E69440C|nr:pectinesterase/pectinesterase inhibitor PPE8B-like [Trifolium pratense]
MMVTSILQFELNNVDGFDNFPIESPKGKHNGTFNLSSFWVDSRDQKMLRKAAKHIFDVVVAADGSGNFTKVMDVVHATSKSNMKCYCHTRKEECVHGEC